MTDNNAQWSDKKPEKPDHVHKRMEHWEKHLHEEDRNRNAKETFDDLTKRAAQPEKPAPGKSADPDSYTGK